MVVQKVNIRETRGIIHFGNATISGINVEFAYDYKADKFTGIAYDIYAASGIFEEGGRDTPQEYIVGRAISKYLKSL